ncbi:hypothetical protein Naga_101613g1 [Nannochloropsis gaditana]|uniref:Uncharacterized protein n=1 Tax=Nannochloropsis gaditana TaxID=72520 RepID=W7TIP2_9STRA|nr:hypothetical protein Naga_101613g1 [Nannochloropsis gaditana]
MHSTAWRRAVAAVVPTCCRCRPPRRGSCGRSGVYSVPALILLIVMTLCLFVTACCLHSVASPATSVHGAQRGGVARICTRR